MFFALDYGQIDWGQHDVLIESKNDSSEIGTSFAGERGQKPTVFSAHN